MSITFKELCKPYIELTLITHVEENILRWTISNKIQTIVNSDIRKNVLKNKSTQQISNILKGLVNRKMLMPFNDSPRKYFLRFDNNYLLRGIMQILEEKDFLPFSE